MRFTTGARYVVCYRALCNLTLSIMAIQHSHVALASQHQDVAAFQRLELYDWDSDPAFQSGLQAILGSNPSKETAEHLTLRARCFYYARFANFYPINSGLES